MENLTPREGMPKKYLFFFLLIAVSFSSCKHDEVYFKYHEIAKAEWRGSDELIFDIDSSLLLVGHKYEAYLEITNNTDYPYQNIWIYFEDNFVNDTVFVQSKHEYKLSDDYGKWLGAGFASLFQSSFEYKDRILVKEKRNYRIKISHGMYDEPLTGIEKIGLRIKNVN